MVQTFLLEIATIFSNGTIIVAKTLPCEAAGEFDICFVEVGCPGHTMPLDYYHLRLWMKGISTILPNVKPGKPCHRAVFFQAVYRLTKLGYRLP